MAEMTRKKTKKNKESVKAARIFTDREELRAAFWTQYAEKNAEIASGDDYIRVLNYYGFGGIGKSSLLKKLMEELDEKIEMPLYINYDFETATDLRTMLLSLKKQLITKYKYAFPLFDLGLYFYAQKCGEKADPVEKRELISSSPLLSLIVSVADNIPGISVVTKILSTIDEAAAFGRTKAYLKKHERVIRQLEYAERDEVYKKLPELFSTDLERNVEKITQPLVIFLDTYELLVNEMSSVGEPLLEDSWLRGENGPVQNVPKLLWVIAGREKLKWSQFDADWEASVDSHILGTLSEQDSTSFLHYAGIKDELLCKQLYTLTKGTPVYLDLCIECFEKLQDRGESVDISKFGKSNIELIERFVRYMDDSQKDLAYMTACLGKWNDELFAVIAPQILPGWSYTTYEKLKDYSFVSLLDNGYYSIHQTVGETLIEKCPAIIKTKTADALKKHFSTVLRDCEIFYADYAMALTYLVQSGLLSSKNRKELYAFFEDYIEQSLFDLICSGKFEEASTIFDMFSPKDGKEYEDLLFAAIEQLRFAYYTDLCKYEEASVCIQRALSICKRFLGQKDPKTLLAMYRMSICLNNLGKTDEALNVAKDLLAKRKNSLGETHPDTLVSMGSLAMDLAMKGYKEEAKKISEELLNKIKQSSWDIPSKLLLASNLLSASLGKLEQYEQALSIAQEAYEKSKQFYGENRKETILAMWPVFDALFNMEKFDDALKLERIALEKCERLFGHENVRTLNAISHIRSALCALEKYKEALDVAKDLLERSTRALGEDHKDTILALYSFGQILFHLERYEEALAVSRDLFERRERAFGGDKKDTLDAMHDIGYALFRLERYDEVREVLKNLLSRSKSVLGENHPATLATMENLLITMLQIEESDETISFANTVLEKEIQILGEEHPNTQYTREIIDKLKST